MSMYEDTENFVADVMRQQNGSTYWSACNRKLAEQVYECVKEMIPKAKYYEFEGLQFITVNDEQEETLLYFIENLRDMYEHKICEINNMRCQIMEAGT